MQHARLFLKGSEKDYDADTANLIGSIGMSFVYHCGIILKIPTQHRTTHRTNSAQLIFIPTNIPDHTGSPSGLNLKNAR